MRKFKLLPPKEKILYYYTYDKDKGKLYFNFPITKGKYKRKIGDEAGSGTPYLNVYIENKVYKVHRIIYFLETGEQPVEIDHKDKDKLNNKFNNLRDGTDGVNARNKNPSSANKSGYKGSFWREKQKKWISQAQFKGKIYSIGAYDTNEEAAEAYDGYYRLKYYKQEIKVLPFHNFPDAMQETIPFQELILSVYGETPPIEFAWGQRNERPCCIKGNPCLLVFPFTKKELLNTPQHLSVFLHEIGHAVCFTRYPERFPKAMNAEKAIEAVIMAISLRKPSNHWRVSHRHPYFLMEAAKFVLENSSLSLRELVDLCLDHFYS